MKESTAGVLAYVIMIVVIFVLTIAASAYSCEQKSISFDEHRFGIFAGCMVKHEGRWIPLENIRGFD